MTNAQALFAVALGIAALIITAFATYVVTSTTRVGRNAYKPRNRDERRKS